MQHNTAATIAALKKHLSPLLGDLTLEVFEASDHDSMVDGEPVAAVQVEGAWDIYPVGVVVNMTSISGDRSFLTRRWAVDRMVDDSDPSVGFFGSEPVHETILNTLPEALLYVGTKLAADQINASLEAEAEEEMAEDLVAAAQMAARYWAGRGF
jgi:hypothetical protein